MLRVQEALPVSSQSIRASVITLYLFERLKRVIIVSYYDINSHNCVEQGGFVLSTATIHTIRKILGQCFATASQDGRS